MQHAWPSRNGQFLISDGTNPAPRDVTRHRSASLAIDTYGDVRLTRVEDSSGALIGTILGTVIDLDAGAVPDLVRFDTDLTASNADVLVERHIYPLAGSFIFILDVPSCRRIYLDADGTKSVVYDPVARVAGATAMTLLDAEEYRQRLRTDLHRKLGVDQAGWFPAGLTAHAGIQRLICNHYLDLDSWNAQRHWPREAIQPASDVAAGFDLMLDRIRRTVDVLRQAGDVSIALTAGVDSRFVLSAMHAARDEVELVTVAAPGGELDVASASVLARRFGLRHEVLPYRRAAPQQAQAWLVRAGHCIAGANMTMHPSVVPLEERYFVGGLGGEIGRGFLWLNATPDTQIDACGLVDRLKFPREPEVLEAVERWLEPIAHFDALFKLDLAYLELRMSSWAFADAYANPVRNELHPMISRANFEAMLGVPWKMRQDGTVFRDAIARAWPELLTLPINRYGDWRDAAKRARDIVRNPRKVVRKIRQLARLRQQAV